MPTDDPASGGPDERQTENDPDDGGRPVTRRTVLQGTAAAVFGGAALRTATGRGRADHSDPVDWTATELEADRASAEFGSDLAFDEAGETLVVGDPMRREGDVRPGGASVYTAADDGWTRETVLAPWYRAGRDQVGASVAVDAAGETVAVGVPGEDALAFECGAVSVFVRDGDSWTHEAKLEADDAEARDVLGTAVAIDDAGERILAGAPGVGPDGGDAGAVYAFDRTGDDGDASWSQSAKLTLEERSDGDDAGAALSLSGDGATALVGAPGANEDDGAVAVFTDDPWSQTGTVDRPEDAGAAFGRAVATNGADGLAGAPETASDSESDSGTGGAGPSTVAGVLTGGRWQTAQHLVDEDAPTGERIGTAVGLATDGDSAVVGAVFDGDAAAGDGDSDDDSDEESDGDATPTTGRVRVYVGGDDGWARTHQLTPSDPDEVTEFGRAVALDGDGYLVAVAGKRNRTAGAGESEAAAAMPARGGQADQTTETGTVTVFTRESPKLSIVIEPDEEWPAKVPHDGDGEVAVGIEHTEAFDPATVDVGTLRFGPPAVVDEGDGATPLDGGSREDLDSDGHRDLVVRFPVADAGFDPDHFSARLVGETVHGTPISDHDFVVTTDGGGMGDESDGGAGDGDADGSDGGGGENGGDGDGSGAGDGGDGDDGSDSDGGADGSGNDGGDGDDGGAGDGS